MDEINMFLMKQDMLIYLVVFDTEATKLGWNLYPDLETYISDHYVCEKSVEEYGHRYFGCASVELNEEYDDFVEQKESALEERIKHMSDTFQEYLMYLIEVKKLPLKGEKELDFPQSYMLYEVEEDEENNPVVMYIEDDTEYTIVAQYFSNLLSKK